MEKKVLFLYSFSALEIIPSSYGKIIHDLNREFKNFYIVNTDNLEIIFKSKNCKKRKTEFFKNIKLFNPKKFKELDEFINGEECLVINGISRRLRYFFIFYYLAKKKIPQIMITHLGNIQPEPYYYRGKFKHKLNNFFVRTLPHFLFNFLVLIKIFSKIEIRFISNINLFNQINSKSFKRIFSYVKKFKLVNSVYYEESFYKIKTKQKHILFLELPPDYVDVSEITGKFSYIELSEHYNRLNKFLLNIKKLYKKKIIISISPKYDLRETKKRFKNFKIVNRDVQRYIRDSFLIVFYDSSVILYAALSNKPIINITSNIYEKINYKTDLYNKYLNLKKINIYNNFDYNKKKLLADLKLRTKSYKKFFNKYLPKKNYSANDQIIKTIKNKYF